MRARGGGPGAGSGGCPVCFCVCKARRRWARTRPGGGGEPAQAALPAHTPRRPPAPSLPSMSPFRLALAILATAACLVAAAGAAASDGSGTAGVDAGDARSKQRGHCPVEGLPYECPPYKCLKRCQNYDVRQYSPGAGAGAARGWGACRVHDGRRSKKSRQRPRTMRRRGRRRPRRRARRRLQQPPGGSAWPQRRRHWGCPLLRSSCCAGAFVRACALWWLFVLGTPPDHPTTLACPAGTSVPAASPSCRSWGSAQRRQGLQQMRQGAKRRWQPSACLMERHPRPEPSTRTCWCSGV